MTLSKTNLDAAPISPKGELPSKPADRSGLVKVLQAADAGEKASKMQVLLYVTGNCLLLPLQVINLAL